MRKGNLFALLTCFSLGVSAFTFEEAQSVYMDKFDKSPHSVQECGDYVFVILEGVNDFNSERDFKRTILDGQLEAIEKYIGKSSGEVISPFSKLITDRLVPLAGFRMPECKSCKIDEYRFMTKYRHVSAFEALPLRKARNEVMSRVPILYTTDEWCELLNLRLAIEKLDKDKCRFWAEVGAVTPLMTKMGGVEWVIENGDGVAINQVMSQWTESESEEACDLLLRVNPVFLPALKQFAEFAEKKQDWLLSMNRRFKVSICDPDVVGIKKISDKCCTKYESTAWREYASLYERAIRANTFTKDTSVAFWKYVLNTFGHLKFSRNQSKNSRNAESLFAECKTLFLEGRELERILKMLRESIELMPNSSEKWRYYAAALRAAKRDLDAVIAYHQALTINPTDERALVDISLLYKKLGCVELAKGVAWYVVVNSKDSVLRAKVKPLLDGKE